jgi:hypothetical protein
VLVLLDELGCSGSEPATAAALALSTLEALLNATERADSRLTFADSQTADIQRSQAAAAAPAQWGRISHWGGGAQRGGDEQLDRNPQWGSDPQWRGDQQSDSGAKLARNPQWGSNNPTLGDNSQLGGYQQLGVGQVGGGQQLGSDPTLGGGSPFDSGARVGVRTRVVATTHAHELKIFALTDARVACGALLVDRYGIYVPVTALCNTRHCPM